MPYLGLAAPWLQLDCAMTGSALGGLIYRFASQSG
jgi:hypothetical protein